MQTFAFPLSPRRRRLAWGGALFLALDAIVMGAALWWIKGGRHPALALGLAGAGVAVSALLALALDRRPRATLANGILRVEAGYQRVSVAIEGARLAEIDLARPGAPALPRSLVDERWWQPGDALGWQRDGGGRWFAVLPGRGPAIEVVAADGERLWLMPEDPGAFRAALLAAGAREA